MNQRPTSQESSSDKGVPIMSDQTPPFDTTIHSDFPFLNPLHLGEVRIVPDAQLFLDAIHYGMACFYEDDASEQMSARELFEKLRTSIVDEDDGEPPAEDEWRVGFLFGKIAGLLNPELRDSYRDFLTYLEALSHKCEQHYPERTSALKAPLVAPHITPS